MKKKNICKIMSLLLSGVLVFTFIGIKDGITSAEQVDVPLSESENIESEVEQTIVHSIPASITDWTGITDGAGKDGYIPRTYYTNAVGDERDAIRPRISASGEGMDGSCALVLGGESSAVTKYDTSLAFPEKGSLKRRKEHTIKMKLKLAAGSVDTLKLGIRESTSDQYFLQITGAELTGEWQEFSFNYTASTQSNNYVSRLLFSYTAPDGGAKLFIDDIFVSLVDSDENLFGDGSFETKFIEKSFEDYDKEDALFYKPYTLESLKHDKLFGFNGDYESEVATIAVEDKIGVAQSYALKLSGDDKAHTLLLNFPAKGTLKNNTEYEIGFKIKANGAAGKLSFGVCEKTTPHVTLEFDTTDSEKYFLDEFRYYSFNYTTTDECSGQTNYLNINYELPEGSEVYIDEIEVYNTAAVEKVNLYERGSFELSYYSEEFSNEPVENAVYEPYELTDYKPIVNYINSNPKNALYNNDNASIAKGEGVRESYALKLDGTGSNMRFYITIGSGVGGLKSDTEYMFMVKLRREGTGKINSFSYGYNASWKETAVFDYNDDMITDEYMCFGGKSTLHSEASSGWCHLSIGFNAEVGATLYVDEIVIYRTDDAEKSNIFTTGTFDFMYYEKKFDNSVDPNTVYVPNKIENYTSTRFFLGFGYDTNSPTHKDDPQLEDVSVVEGEGANGSAAFKIVGDGTSQQVFFRISVLGGMVNNCEYILGFKIKRGEAFDTTDASFRMGVIERSALHSAIGFNGEAIDRNITDEYSYYYVHYTTTNECSGAWHYLAFTYTLPEGAEIYLDDIEVIPVTEKAIWMRHADNSAINLIRQGDFDMVDLGQEGVEFLDKEQLPKNEEAYGGGVPVKNAITGHHALAFGFDKNNKVTSSWEKNLTPSDPGDTHKISFWIKVVGDGVTASFSMGDSAWLTKTYEMDFNQYEQGKWTKIELYYTDNYTRYNCVTYRRVRFNVTCPAGTGVLIDNIEIYRVGDAHKLNIYSGAIGNFENYTDYPIVQWSDRYTHKKGK